MKTLITLLAIGLATSLTASIRSEVPQKIGDNTYWLTIDSDQSKKGKQWNFMSDTPPPLLPNEALGIARKAKSKKRIASGNTRIAKLKIMVTMDGEAIIPKEKD